MIRTHTLQAKQPKRLLDACNLESGKIYTQTMAAHWRIWRKHNVWLKPRSCEKLNDFLFPETTLHAHSRDAAQQGFPKACKTTKALHREGVTDARFPHRTKKFRSTIWKNTGIRVKGDTALLARARGFDPIRVKIPETLKGQVLVEARLVHSKETGHYAWHFVTDDLLEIPLRTEGCSVAVDEGEIHPAACTNGKDALIISCRELRSTGQGLAKAIAKIDKRLAKKQRGSRRAKKLGQAKAKARRRKETRQRDMLHKVSRAIVDYADGSNAKEIVFGDVRTIANEAGKGKKQNQKLSLWPHGKLKAFTAYKAEALGINTLLQEESFTSQTCPAPDCAARNKTSGRKYTCRKCGFTGHRDGQVGAPNILSKHIHHECGRVFIPFNQLKYRHPFLIKQIRESVAMPTPCM